MKNTNNTLAAIQLKQVIEVITDMDNDDTISIYNDYANCNGYELIFNNDEHTINDLFLTPYDAIRQTNNKDYKDHEDYFTFNGYGHAVSFDYRLSDNSPIDISELAQWLINEDKLSEYDITVTTLDDKYNAILDHVSDIDSVASIQSLLSYLDVDFLYTNEWIDGKNRTIDSYIEKYIDVIIAHFIDKNDNDQLDNLLDYFRIDL